MCKESFLGINSESGFYSLYEDFINKRSRVYVIKGGPGTGKSSLMRSVAGKAEQMGYDVEYMHCSSDPSSLDGIYVKQLDAGMVDGTPPHVLEPPYPGAVGSIVNIYPFWDAAKLRAAAPKIRELNGRISALFERTYLYLGAAGKLQRELQQIGAEMCRRAKLKGYSERMCNRYVKPQNKPPHEEKRLLSAFTPEGNVFYGGVLRENMEKILVFEDEYGISSRVLELLRVRALKNGHNIVSCYHPLIPGQLEHIVFEDAGLCVCTSNSLHRIDALPYCRINIGRFLDAEQEKRARGKVNFLIRTRDDILAEAVGILRCCHALHDELEEYYKAAMDFDALGEYGEKIAAEFLQPAQ